MNENNKIAVVMFFTLDYQIGFYTMSINKKYCEKNKYDFFVFHDIPNNLKNKHPAWYKLYYIQKVFQEHNYEYVMWIDGDAFFCNSNLRIENYINSEKDFIIGRDPGYDFEHFYKNKHIVNSGVFILKNSKWSRKFIDNLLTNKKFYKWNLKKNWEQEAIRESISENYDNICKQIQIIENTNFNNNTNDVVNYVKRGGYIIHLTNFMGKFKNHSLQTIEIFHKHFKDIL